jgi:hypothetical protein
MFFIHLQKIREARIFENLINGSKLQIHLKSLNEKTQVYQRNYWIDRNWFVGWAGHTHGGQCKPPFLPPPMLPVKNKRYTAGKFELANDRTLYINRALGHLWQVRFNVRPEITFFELEKG